MRVRLGSHNDAKLEAVRRGLGAFFERVDLEAVAAESGVSPQPLGLDEIILGARSRARQSWDSERCELSAGIEDGLIALAAASTGWLNVGCCVLYDGRVWGLGLTAGFEYPPACVGAATAEPRTPIGDAFDASFEPPPGWPRALSGWGNIGQLTGGVLTRAEYGAQAVCCAFVRLLHPALYDVGST